MSGRESIGVPVIVERYRIELAKIIERWTYLSTGTGMEEPGLKPGRRNRSSPIILSLDKINRPPGTGGISAMTTALPHQPHNLVNQKRGCELKM